MLGRLVTLVTLLIGCSIASSVAAQDDALLAALRSGGHVGLMRHARAPGSNDPPEFTLGDCATQRNLSAGGREQAAEIGAYLRRNGIERIRIVSSQWCRCIDTAELLELGPVEALPSLNSLVSYPRERGTMTDETRAWILEQDLSEPLLLVTHQINIGALVRAYPDEGEIVVVRPTADGALDVLGTIRAVAPPR
jgi:broad specificity phosphatase PhoE